MTEPCTKAGRRLVEGDRQALFAPAEVKDLVIAIEREAAAAPSLDVERLAAVLHRFHEGRLQDEPIICDGATARFIAAEYARLSEGVPEL